MACDEYPPIFGAYERVEPGELEAGAVGVQEHYRTITGSRYNSEAGSAYGAGTFRILKRPRKIWLANESDGGYVWVYRGSIRCVKQATHQLFRDGMKRFQLTCRVAPFRSKVGRRAWH